MYIDFVFLFLLIFIFKFNVLVWCYGLLIGDNIKLCYIYDD